MHITISVYDTICVYIYNMYNATYIMTYIYIYIYIYEHITYIYIYIFIKRKKLYEN